MKPATPACCGARQAECWSGHGPLRSASPLAERFFLGRPPLGSQCAAGACGASPEPNRLCLSVGDGSMKRIQIHPAACSGCRACMVACVVRHDGRFGTATSRIYVAKADAAGTDEPRVCRHCRRAPCVAACPTGALHRDEEQGVVRVRGAECTGCGACAQACPFGAVTLHPQAGTALICDLCDGDPACVKRCATGAIEYVGCP